MSYLSEFPNYDGELYIPERGFHDHSYHNDIMPRAGKIIEIPNNNGGIAAEVEIIIWQDYINPELREYENGKRYIFEIEVNDIPIYEYQTDDLEKIKELIRGVE